MSQTITRYATIGMILIGFIAVVYACGRATDATRGNTKLEKLSTGAIEGMDFSFQGDPTPADAFIAPNGETVSLADFKGQTIVLNVWATWCAPCEKEMPSLAALQTSRGGDSFKVIALSIDEVSERDFAVGQLNKLSGGALDFYQAETLGITYSLGVSGFPTTIIYDRRGNEVSRFQGDTEWAGYDALAFIDAVIEK